MERWQGRAWTCLGRDRGRFYVQKASSAVSDFPLLILDAASSSVQSSRFFPQSVVVPAPGPAMVHHVAPPVHVEASPSSSFSSPGVVEEPMGSESDLEGLFDLSEWPSVSKCTLDRPVWISEALSSNSSGPPGFSIDEGHQIRVALTHLMSSADLSSVSAKLVRISQALAWASAKNDLIALSAILNCRTDPNCQIETPLNASPMHFATFFGNLEIIDLLINSGNEIHFSLII